MPLITYQKYIQWLHNKLQKNIVQKKLIVVVRFLQTSLKKQMSSPMQQLYNCMKCYARQCYDKRKPIEVEGYLNCSDQVRCKEANECSCTGVNSGHTEFNLTPKLRKIRDNSQTSNMRMGIFTHKWCCCSQTKPYYNASSRIVGTDGSY